MSTKKQHCENNLVLELLTLQTDKEITHHIPEMVNDCYYYGNAIVFI